MDCFRLAVRYLTRLVPVSTPSPARDLCRAFIDYLASDPGTPEREKASRKLRDSNRRELAAFLTKGAEAIEREMTNALETETELGASLEQLATSLGQLDPQSEIPQELAEAFWAVFLPEAEGVRASWDTRVEELRRQRTVEVESLCSSPIAHPASEILWTANALLTVPSKDSGSDNLHLDDAIRRQIETADMGEQEYWYDHPVQIGVAPEKNEVLYGLRGLTQMLDFEKRRGNAASGDRLDVALSVSVTHPGLHAVAKPYIESVLKASPEVHDLNIHIFTEDDTEKLIADFLVPAARQFGLEASDPSLFDAVFGVDGPYGRHYNFLKAISAIWQIVQSPVIKATFKIDLDQVFPQDRLVEETGKSAFELLTTPLWGAIGRDSEGNPVELGMLAGALVNQSDIDQGLFTPDVRLPEPPYPADRWVFATQVPQALSTVAEMMTRYDREQLDGVRRCSSRVHVTGGTTGIRVDSLRRYRPFTLSTISRAEDQAYIMSVLYENAERYLRYIHVPGLIMRHDKHGFAADAIKTAAAGKSVGDYERMLLFSGYARGLPWPWEKTRTSLRPFTGSFVHRTPITTSLLAFALKALAADSANDTEQLLEVGQRKLGTLLERLEKDPGWLEQSYQYERHAWDSFYRLLECVDEETRRGSPEAGKSIERARAVIEGTKLDAD
jgi:hypothetical protein